MRTAHNQKENIIIQILFFIKKGKSLREVVKFLGITEQTFYRWIRENDILYDRYEKARIVQSQYYEKLIAKQLKINKQEAWETMWIYGRMKKKKKDNKGEKATIT